MTSSLPHVEPLRHHSGLLGSACAGREYTHRRTEEPGPSRPTSATRKSWSPPCGESTPSHLSDLISDHCPPATLPSSLILIHAGYMHTTGPLHLLLPSQ